MMVNPNSMPNELVDLARLPEASEEGRKLILENSETREKISCWFRKNPQILEKSADLQMIKKAIEYKSGGYNGFWGRLCQITTILNPFVIKAALVNDKSTTLKQIVVTNAIDELQDLADKIFLTPSTMGRDEIAAWMQKYEGCFSPGIFRELPKSKILQLTSLIQKFPVLEEMAEKLPEHVQGYLNILETSDLRGLLATWDSKNESDIKKLAWYVNNKDLSLNTLLREGVSKENLLQLAPHLRYVDLRGIDEDQPPDFLIKLIKKCSDLNFLFIKNDEITTLPELLNCKNLNCSGCTALKALPVLPNCRVLYCNGCPLLKVLPALPNCQELLSNGCTSLRALPELPNCQILYCNGCTSLRALPELPNCRVLFCSDCTSLRALPELPNCGVLNCDECTSLQALPELPNCQVLNCDECTSLQALPELPNCQVLDCVGCPLRGLPQLRQDAQVFSGAGEAAFTRFKVDTRILQENPVELLRTLGEILLNGRPFPNIEYVTEEGLSVAIDIGGVRRDFITKLFDGLFCSEYGLKVDRNDDGIMPKMEENQQYLYQVVGRLFALCSTPNSGFKTGQIFSSALFTLIFSDEDSQEAQMSKFLFLKGIPEVISLTRTEALPDGVNPKTLLQASYLLDSDGEWTEKRLADFSSEENRELLRTNVLEEARSDGRLQAASCIATEMKSFLGQEVWGSLKEAGADALKIRIQGVLTKDLLKEKLEWSKGSPFITDEQVKQVKGFLLHWIGEASPETLEMFMRVVTSNKTLGGRTAEGKDYLTMNIQNTQSLIPVAHTCFFMLDLSATYKDQEEFNARLDRLLEEGLGFSMA